MLSPQQSLQLPGQLQQKHDFSPDALSDDGFLSVGFFFFLVDVYAAGTQSKKGQSSRGATKNRESATCCRVRLTQAKV